MLLSDVNKKYQKELKTVLQDTTSTKVERLVASLFGKLLNIPIYIASSGFQFGGDAGPSGFQNRTFRIECKKYRDSTSLNRRELLGEIDHAIYRDSTIEAWILVTTRTVNEELAEDLIKKGEKEGLPVIIFDWKDNYLSHIAALCASFPEIVNIEISHEAACIAEKLKSISKNTVDQILLNLESWCLGFNQLREMSHERLIKIWNSPREANAIFGQNIAGGVENKKIRRKDVDNSISEWWNDSTKEDAPAVIFGLEGVGKTWATIDWLVTNIINLPICLIISSSEVSDNIKSKETFKKFLSEQLQEITGVRNSSFWLKRLNSFLKRPKTEGPTFIIFFDGLNQNSYIDWLKILKLFQSEDFSGKLRIIVSTRKSHFESKLSGLRSLVVRPVKIFVEIYNKESGGELDEMLALQNLTRNDLHPNLIELARIPRLFKLVIYLRDKFKESQEITIHMLLWEYGKDTFGERANLSFSESEWKDWLKEIALNHINGIKAFSIKSIGEMAVRSYLSEQEVYMRLSEIVDGHFIDKTKDGEISFSATIVSHALGAALLSHIDNLPLQNFGSFEEELLIWFEPISGLDEKSEILRAAVSILIEKEDITKSSKAGVLLTEWLNSHNINEYHILEIINLSQKLCPALIDVIENTANKSNSSARTYAINALRNIPRNDYSSYNLILSRAISWFKKIPIKEKNDDDDSVKHSLERLKNRIGKNTIGKIKVLNVDFEIIDKSNGLLKSIFPFIIEGYPLLNAIEVFEHESIVFAITGYSDGDVRRKLKWLCLLNEVDQKETNKELKKVSESVLRRNIEHKINNKLPSRVSALLLWLIGTYESDEKAVSIDPDTESLFSYEDDYLSDPSNYFFSLERRHAEIVLKNNNIPLHARIQRTKDLWLDPTFIPPQSFVEELIEKVENLDFDKIDLSRHRSLDDHIFEDLQPAIAICNPKFFTEVTRKRIKSFESCPSESVYWKAIHATDYILIGGKEEFQYAERLRFSYKKQENDQDFFPISQLLLLELLGLKSQEQYETILEAGLDFIMIDFKFVLLPPSPDIVDNLIYKYGNGPSIQRDNLIQLLSLHTIKISNFSYNWFYNIVYKENYKLKGLVFEILSRSEPYQFGLSLLGNNWSWNPEDDYYANHYGSEAIVIATKDLPLKEIINRIAPWKLLWAVRIRGNKIDEIRLASEEFCKVLVRKISPPEVGVVLRVKKSRIKDFPFVYSASPIPDENKDFLESLKYKKQEARQKEADERAYLLINEARKNHAYLYLTNIDVEDIFPIYQYAQNIIKLLIEGLDNLSNEFINRVLVAESVFLSICEVLLEHKPYVGVKLWKALYQITTIEFVGPANINELFHILFRVKDSNEVLILRNEMLDLKHCNTDMALLEIAVVASYNKKTNWLIENIKNDSLSDISWKQKRAVILSGFLSGNELPVHEAWHENEIKTEQEAHKLVSNRHKFKEASSRYWFRLYLKSEDLDEVNAAWVIFLQTVDNRIWVWFEEDIKKYENETSLFKRKKANIEINKSKIENLIYNNTKKLKDKFLNRQIVKGIGPWIN